VGVQETEQGGLDGGEAQRRRVRDGVAAGVGAFTLWGLSPIYWKFLVQIGPFEVLAHRILWAMLFLGGWLAGRKRLGLVLGSLRDPKILRPLILSTLLIAVNWMLFIWAVSVDRVLDASLGYYLNPLMSVALGFFLLKESLSKPQWLAVALAALGVGYMTLSVDTFPWISLTLALSFAAYGYVRKIIPVESLDGLFVETLLTAPPALAFLLWLEWTGQGEFIGLDLIVMALLIFAGPVTLIPLLLFNLAARRVRLSTVGLTQYLAPTIQFFLAVYLYGEPFTTGHLITFALIWTGLVIYSVDGVVRDRRLRARRRLAAETAAHEAH